MKRTMPFALGAIVLSVGFALLGLRTVIYVPNRFYNGISNVNPTFEELVNQRFPFRIINPAWVKTDSHSKWEENWVRAEVFARNTLLFLGWMIVMFALLKWKRLGQK